MKIVFFGTPKFAATTLSKLVDRGSDIRAVVTRPDRPRGRSGKPAPSAVKVFSQEYLPNVPIYQPEKVSVPEYYAILRQHDADLFVVVAYGEILKQELLDMPHKACINVHASLLPKYRGAAPIQRCIMEGEKESGICIMHMVRKMDAGNIIKDVKIPVPMEMTGGELEQSLQRLGADALIEVIDELKDQSLPGRPQDADQVTFAPKIGPEDSKIDWSVPAQKVHNLIRAMDPQPKAWCNVTYRESEKRLKLTGSSLVKDVTQPPGTIINADDTGVVIACGSGAVCIASLQIQGKRLLPAGEFLRGVDVTALKILTL